MQLVCISVVVLGVMSVMAHASMSALPVPQYYEILNERNRRLHEELANEPGLADHLARPVRQYDDDGYEVLVPARPRDSNDYSDSDEDDFERSWQSQLENMNELRRQRTEGLYGTRDTEAAYQNHLYGPHVILGGNGRYSSGQLYGNEEGNSEADELAEQNQSTEMVKDYGKSDKKLPAYCTPPNPCPLGVDVSRLASPCDPNVQNTKQFNKAWVWRQMLSGQCKCDSKHMHVCPGGQQGSALSAADQKRDSKRNDNWHQTVVKKDGKINNPYLIDADGRTV